MLKVEKAWSVHKLQRNITARHHDYETRYREFLNQEFPETWGSFRAFECTRTLYNAVTKLGVFAPFKMVCSKHCDFLDPELSHETAIGLMKDSLASVMPGFSALILVEKQAVALELLLLCVGASVLLISTLRILLDSYGMDHGQFKYETKDIALTYMLLCYSTHKNCIRYHS